MSLLVKFGERCRTFLDAKLRGLKLKHLEIDEIWTFVRRKQATILPDEDDRINLTIRTFMKRFTRLSLVPTTTSAGFTAASK